jgi:hypothetical protein
LRFNSNPRSQSRTSDTQKDCNSYQNSNENSGANENIVTVYKVESEQSSGQRSPFTNRFTKIENPNISKPIAVNIRKVKDEEKNSSFAKIEKLKKYLEKILGLENFLEIYFKVNVTLKIYIKFILILFLGILS